MIHSVWEKYLWSCVIDCQDVAGEVDGMPSMGLCDWVADSGVGGGLYAAIKCGSGALSDSSVSLMAVTATSNTASKTLSLAQSVVSRFVLALSTHTHTHTQARKTSRCERARSVTAPSSILSCAGGH